MISQLKSNQIDELVADNIVGTLVCFDRNEKIKYPIMYVSEGHFVYSYAKDLEKIQLMRKDPAVLLKVYKEESGTGWSSADVLGIFEELKGVEAEIGRCLIKDKLLASTMKDHNIDVNESNEACIQDIVEESDVIFRIQIIKKTGKVHHI